MQQELEDKIIKIETEKDTALSQCEEYKQKLVEVRQRYAHIMGVRKEDFN